MKFVAIKSSQGSLGKNNGTDLAPDLILEGRKKNVLKIPQDNFIELFNVLENADGDFFVGGDHSITYGLFKGFKKKYGDAGLIVFDAHADCVNNFSPPTHEDFVRVLIEEKIVKPENVLLIGLRNVDPIEMKFIKNKKIKCLFMGDIKSVDQVIDEIESFSKKLKSVYLSLDIDVLDSKYAPGTGYPEKNGMKPDFLFTILSRIKIFKNIKRVDLVEVNPIKDKDDKTLDSAKNIIQIFSTSNIF